MEIGIVVRILTLLLAAAALAIHFASPILFPGASGGFDLPLVIVLLLCFTTIWRQTGKSRDRKR